MANKEKDIKTDSANASNKAKSASKSKSSAAGKSKSANASTSKNTKKSTASKSAASKSNSGKRTSSDSKYDVYDYDEIYEGLDDDEDVPAFKKSRKKTNVKKAKTKEPIDPSAPKYQVVMLSMLAIAIFITLCYIFPSFCGIIGGGLRNILFGIFSYSSALLPCLLIIRTVYYKRDLERGTAGIKFFFSFAVMIFASIIFHAISTIFNEELARVPFTEVQEFYACGKDFVGGGVIGGVVGALLIKGFGIPGTLIISILFMLIFCIFLFGITPDVFWHRIAFYFHRFCEQRQQNRKARAEENARRAKMEQEREAAQREAAKKEAARQEAAQRVSVKKETAEFSGSFANTANTKTNAKTKRAATETSRFDTFVNTNHGDIDEIFESDIVPPETEEVRPQPKPKKEPIVSSAPVKEAEVTEKEFRGESVAEYMRKSTYLENAFAEKTGKAKSELAHELSFEREYYNHDDKTDGIEKLESTVSVANALGISRDSIETIPAATDISEEEDISNTEEVENIEIIDDIDSDDNDIENIEDIEENDLDKTEEGFFDTASGFETIDGIEEEYEANIDEPIDEPIKEDIVSDDDWDMEYSEDIGNEAEDIVPATLPEDEEEEIIEEFVEEEPDETLEDELRRTMNDARKQMEAPMAVFEEGPEKEALEEESEEAPKGPTYVFPPLELLKKEPEKSEGGKDAELQQNAEKLVETLKSFNVRAHVGDFASGPTVTRYEIVLEAGTRVRQIMNLVDDISYALATNGVRIEGVIPGKSAIGIEVPNKTAETVYLRTLLEDPKFTEAKSKLTAALGRSVAGDPVYLDIAKMPHLMIAGTTGSGKSVCINTMLISLLYKSTPEEVKLVLIDPKKVELNVYNGIPHLLVPVVFDPKKAAGALHWCVTEMERRFDLIEAQGVRNIAGYNEAIADDPTKEKLPQIVIVIDELADLMMTAANEVETSICRIAQKARAAGMHLIIGTQRPSVDVITGLIKANVPSRIAFTVMSQVDSRTIIDSSGAEKLIGRGDMLYAPVGSMKPMRAQGAFVSDAELESIIDFIKTHSVQAEDHLENTRAIMERIEKEAALCGKKGKAHEIGDDFGSADEEEDPKLKSAIKLAVDSGKISTSLIQRKLSLGYGRAAKLIDEMERRGIVGAPEGQKPREVLISKEQYLEMMMNDDTGAGRISDNASDDEF